MPAILQVCRFCIDKYKKSWYNKNPTERWGEVANLYLQFLKFVCDNIITVPNLF